MGRPGHVQTLSSSYSSVLVTVQFSSVTRNDKSGGDLSRPREPKKAFHSRILIKSEGGARGDLRCADSGGHVTGNENMSRQNPFAVTSCLGNFLFMDPLWRLCLPLCILPHAFWMTISYFRHAFVIILLKTGPCSRNSHRTNM